jgi:hypothetical protein
VKIGEIRGKKSAAGSDKDIASWKRFEVTELNTLLLLYLYRL